MSDIDFDELDKAVNSLMGGVGDKALEKDDQQKLQTLSINSTLKDDEKPAYDKLEQAAQKIGGETLVSDEDRTTVENLPPLSDDSMPAATPTNSAEKSSADDASVPSLSPVTPAVKRPSSGRFMDMVHPSADMRSPSTPSFVMPTPEAPSQPTQPKATPPTPAVSGPLPQSPFLPDAKVEKRPLGGEPSADEPVVADTGVTPGGNEVVETEIINNDEKKIDDGTGDEQRPLDATGLDIEAAMQERKLQSIESAAATETEAAPVSIQAVESGDTGKAAQHTTEPAADKSGDIYNVGEYHQPLNHPAKQKSGWGIVVVIIVIIVLAMAAAGAAYFIFAKP